MNGAGWKGNKTFVICTKCKFKDQNDKDYKNLNEVF